MCNLRKILRTRVAVGLCWVGFSDLLKIFWNYCILLYIFFFLLLLFNLYSVKHCHKCIDMHYIGRGAPHGFASSPHNGVENPSYPGPLVGVWWRSHFPPLTFLLTLLPTSFVLTSMKLWNWHFHASSAMQLNADW